jgi:adenylylsulfate kinase
MTTGAALWFTGLPGSGKSTLARAVAEALTARGLPVTWLAMDARRKDYFPNPTYDAAGREKAYGMFITEAAKIAASGRLVLMDASAPKRSMRAKARTRIPKFAEVHVRCTLETAMAREAARPERLVMAGLYAKALERRDTGREFPGLGEVVGVDVAFEEDPTAECVVDAEHLGIEDGRDVVLAFVDGWLEK